MSKAFSLIGSALRLTVIGWLAMTAVAAVAGLLEDGIAAFKRDDYSTAQK